MIGGAAVKVDAVFPTINIVWLRMVNSSSNLIIAELKIYIRDYIIWFTVGVKEIIWKNKILK